MRRDSGPDEDVRQQYGFLFEGCKHLTTLNTAAALVVLAVHQEAGLSLWPLLFFGLSLVASLYGMVAIAITETWEEGPAHANGSLVSAALAFVVGLLFAFLGGINL
jgi:hypothetical protein